MKTLHLSIIIIFLIGLISIHNGNGVLADNTFIGSYVVKDDLALINNQTYYISKPYDSYDSNQTIIFHNVVFAMPTAFTSPPDPSGIVFSLVKFPDGSTEKLGVGVPLAYSLTALSTHTSPQAAFTRFMNNTFVFLVSQDLGLSSPLKQFNSGIAANDVKCEQGLQLVIKLEDGSPACVTSDTAQKLMEHRWTKNQIGVSTLAKPSIGLYHVTTSLQPVILGMSFFINAEVVNNQNTPITYYGGCISPLSVSFDNIQTHTDGIHCLAISKYVLGPHEQISIQSDKINTVYNGTGPDYAHAELKFTYENNGTQASWFTSTQFPIQHAIKLNCTKPFQAQMEEINISVNVKKAIALAYTSPEFLSKVKQYGNVSYMSFYNDLFPDQSCNAYWKGIEVMFTTNDKNGDRNIQVYEDIHLTKVIKIEDFQVFMN